jgi:hypothetical protein
MSRFVMEHLPRGAAVYDANPLNYEAAKEWLQTANASSLIRTTEMITAVQAAIGLPLSQSDASVTLQPGDEALLITLSFSVLLAWAEDNIAPLPEDWRCILLRVRRPESTATPGKHTVSSVDLLSEEPA